MHIHEQDKASRLRAVVTGATGYLGSKVVAALVGAGWEVYVYVRASSDLKLLDTVIHQISCHVIEVNALSLIDATRNIKPDIIIHMASLFVAEHDSSAVEDLIDSNIKYGTLLLEAAVVTDVKYFINTGTAWEYWCEDDLAPACLYAASKRAFQQIIDFYVSANQIEAVTLSLADTYGPGDPRRKIVNLLVGLIETGAVLKLSPGLQRLDLMHVEDVTSAYLHTIKLLMDEPGNFTLQPRYELRTGNIITLKSLVDLIERLSGSRLNVEWGGSGYRKREIMEPYRKYECLPEWEARIDIESGILTLLEQNFQKV